MITSDNRLCSQLGLPPVEDSPGQFGFGIMRPGFRLPETRAHYLDWTMASQEGCWLQLSELRVSVTLSFTLPKASTNNPPPTHTHTDGRGERAQSAPLPPHPLPLCVCPHSDPRRCASEKEIRQIRVHQSSPLHQRPQCSPLHQSPLRTSEFSVFPLKVGVH
ncbi:hypothetical protein AB205_0036970, partial [Aquarana catesbeiana]